MADIRTNSQLQYPHEIMIPWINRHEINIFMAEIKNNCVVISYIGKFLISIVFSWGFVYHLGTEQ